MKPFMMDAFYRDVKSVAGTYVGLLEAAVKIYDKDYAEPRNKTKLREKVSLVEVRKSIGYDNKFTSFFDQTNLLEDLLLHNNVRYHQFLNDPNLLDRLERKEMSFYKGRRVFLVTIRGSDRLKFYIDALTYAFLRIEISAGPSSQIIEKKNGLDSRRNSMIKIIEFREYEGQMYLSHIDVITQIHWLNPKKSDEVRFETELHQQLMVNKVYPNTSSKVMATNTMKPFGLQYQQSRYNKEFWDNYNVIKETPLDKKILIDLEKDLSLEKQFLDNNK